MLPGADAANSEGGKKPNPGWLEKLGELEAYRKSKGNYKGMTDKGVGKRPLSNWLGQQRKARKLYPDRVRTSGGSFALTKARAVALDELFARYPCPEWSAASPFFKF